MRQRPEQRPLLSATIDGPQKCLNRNRSSTIPTASGGGDCGSLLDASVIVITLLVVFFVASIIRGASVPGVALPEIKKPLSRAQGKPEAQAAAPGEYTPKDEEARLASGA